MTIEPAIKTQNVQVEEDIDTHQDDISEEFIIFDAVLKEENLKDTDDDSLPLALTIPCY